MIAKFPYSRPPWTVSGFGVATGKVLMLIALLALMRWPFSHCGAGGLHNCPAATLLGGAIFFASLGIPIYFVSRHFQRRQNRPRARASVL